MNLTVKLYRLIRRMGFTPPFVPRHQFECVADAFIDQCLMNLRLHNENRALTKSKSAPRTVPSSDLTRLTNAHRVDRTKATPCH